jgi:hypothetical protein
MFEQLSFLAVLILTISTLFLLLSQNWRSSIVVLGVQYLAIFWLTALIWPVGLAAVKLVAGWMAGLVLGASQPLVEQVEDSYTGNSAFVFRLLVAGLVWVFIFPAAPALVSFLPVPLPVAQGALLLIGMGLIHLGMTTRPLRVLLGLLTTLSGFEILYAGVERSLMVAGLLAMVNLGLAFVGAYLLAMQTLRPEAPAEEGDF